MGVRKQQHSLFATDGLQGFPVVSNYGLAGTVMNGVEDSITDLTCMAAATVLTPVQPSLYGSNMQQRSQPAFKK